MVALTYVAPLECPISAQTLSFMLLSLPRKNIPPLSRPKVGRTFRYYSVVDAVRHSQKRDAFARASTGERQRAAPAF